MSCSTKQLKVVAFSSCEAEYAAASACCKEMEFVRNVCFDLGMKLHGRLVLAVDNTAVIDSIMITDPDQSRSVSIHE